MCVFMLFFAFCVCVSCDYNVKISLCEESWEMLIAIKLVFEQAYMTFFKFLHVKCRILVMPIEYFGPQHLLNV